MKLSEAIRLGSTMKPQGFDGRGIGSSCAMAAALDAIGRLEAEIIPEDWLMRSSSCPECGKVAAVGDLCTPAHLNDDHRWTRERIADWVETIENAQAETMIDALQPEVTR